MSVNSPGLQYLIHALLPIEPIGCNGTESGHEVEHATLLKELEF